MKKIIFLFLLTCITLINGAQNLMPVKGVVKDASTGEALIGVNILVEDTQAGTITGIDGDFTIEIPFNGSLRISYIGYKPQTLVITNEDFLDIALETDAQIIEEVVVVGYTVQKKRDVLGAISKVESKDISKIPVATTQQALQGRVAGVNVAAQTGAPGAPISVRIRGVNSISLSNVPLYIVDGIPVEG